MICWRPARGGSGERLKHTRRACEQVGKGRTNLEMPGCGGGGVKDPDNSSAQLETVGRPEGVCVKAGEVSEECTKDEKRETS